MNFFENAGSLLDLLNNSTTQDLDLVSQKAGLNAGQTASIMSVALPLILKAINRNTSTADGLASFNQALKDHADDPQFDSLAGYAENVDTNDGDKMLTHVLSDNKGGIIEQIANTLGLTPDAVKRVLIIVTPLLINYFAQNKKSQGLNRDQVREQMTREQTQIEQQASNSTGDLFGGILGSLINSTLNTGSNQSQSTSTGGLLGSLLDLIN